MFKHAVKKLPFAIRYVPDQCKTQTMCSKTVANYPHALGFVPEYYRIQKICDKAVDTYSFTIEYFPDRFKTLEMCDKAVDKCPCWIVFLIKIRLMKGIIKKVRSLSGEGSGSLKSEQK